MRIYRSQTAKPSLWLQWSWWAVHCSERNAQRRDYQAHWKRGRVTLYHRHGTRRGYVCCGNCTRFEGNLSWHYSWECYPMWNSGSELTVQQRERYFDIASKCNKETLIQNHYTADCMQKRNRYMVDQAEYIIAVWDGRPSGTGNTESEICQKAREAHHRYQSQDTFSWKLIITGKASSNTVAAVLDEALLQEIGQKIHALHLFVGDLRCRRHSKWRKHSYAQESQRVI